MFWLMLHASFLRSLGAPQSISERVYSQRSVSLPLRLTHDLCVELNEAMGLTL